MGCTLQIPSHPDNNSNIENDTKVFVQVPETDEIIISIIPIDEAKNALESGEIDYYLAPLDAVDVQNIKSSNNTNITLYPAVSTIMGFYVNPAPAEEGFNPFSSQKVRFALNYLIDRNRIVSDVYNGDATPTITCPWPTHPSYNSVSNLVDSYNITNDMEKGMELLTEAMNEEGAVMVNGKWYYNDSEIVLIIPIFRKSESISDMEKMALVIADELSNAGFEVETQIFNNYNEFSPYVTNPIEQKWHVAVSGAIFYGASKYESAYSLSLYSEEGWWAYNDTTETEIIKSFDYASNEDEWNEINAELTKLYIDESLGLWLVALNSNYGARNEVQRIVYDNYVGLHSYKTVRQVKVPGKTLLNTAVPSLYDEGSSWNPVIIENIYMMNLLNTIHDPVFAQNPISLEKEPLRWSYIIERYTSPQEIPEEVFNWNVIENKWESVSTNETVKTKVTYDLSKYIGVNWHHGEKISWADVLYFIASVNEGTYDLDKQDVFSWGYESKLDNVIGYRINGTNLETYLSTQEVDNDSLLSVGGMFQRIAPLEIYVANDKLVYTEQKYLFYEKYNSNLSVLSLVNPVHIADVLSVMENLSEDEIAPFVTVNGINYLESGVLEARVNASKEWNSIHGHLVISDGAYYMDSYNLTDGSVHLKAFRDPTYVAAMNKK
jgi:peptide/nickel transport system substrate-binding protein